MSPRFLSPESLSIDNVPFIFFGGNSFNHAERADNPEDYFGKIGVISGSIALKSRKLVGEVYKELGYVKSDELYGPENSEKEGIIKDSVEPYESNSTRYGHIDETGNIRATARLIVKENTLDLPAFSEFNVPKKILDSINPDGSKFREVSQLVKNPNREIAHRDDVIELYAKMMTDSINDGVDYWVMSADVRLAKQLRLLFGRKSFKRLADPSEYMGSDTEPMLFEIKKAFTLLGKPYIAEKYKAPFREAWGGLDKSKLDRKSLSILSKHGVIEKTEVPLRELSVMDIAKGGLYTYALSRAGVIPMTELDQHGVNTLFFLLLDVVTVQSYAEGVSAAQNKNLSIARRVGGGVLGLGAFAAPYAYAALSTNDYEKLIPAGGYFTGIYAGLIAGKKIYQHYKERIDPVVDKMSKFIGVKIVSKETVRGK